ncbi:hypothetical protein [Actinosynnema mirum]|uniref:Uncharacterized protein n=1 Tax=Actinosynnema mirum (strain ATCC 29888 / DSM 43827 / JCM 3225 / NBRC 14064 / NCIMB 13271 / NRRL B-12336 / IMRU 3971 / 101) TaxID=446462 RepID=C6WMG2_ACTMD|nr:hypothetical protein [Actinosynnema mirum]ACU36491.1 hypothetical protein Amir_2554 [Actinosynnema mirum DSM 43827]
MRVLLTSVRAAGHVVAFACPPVQRRAVEAAGFEAHGLPPDPDSDPDPDPDLLMLRGNLLLSPFPPSFRDPAFPLPPTAFPVRPVVGPVVRGARTTVHFTPGTVFTGESGDLFARVVEVLAGSHREAALALREEMLGLPEPAAVVPLLEALAR